MRIYKRGKESQGVVYKINTCYILRTTYFPPDPRGMEGD